MPPPVPSGAPSDLAALRERLFPKVVGVCQKLLNNRALGEETAQDVWTDFTLFYASNVRSAAATEAYVRLITVRRCRRMRMIEARQTPLVTEVADAREGPEAQLIASDEERHRQSRLARCIERLDRQAQRLLRMRYHHGMTQESIGEQLGGEQAIRGKDPGPHRRRAAHLRGGRRVIPPPDLLEADLVRYFAQTEPSCGH